MKKLFVIGASLILVVVSASSQSEKKEPPPPPPPKLKEEKIKNTSSTIIDEKVNINKPSEPPVITIRGKGADDFYKRNPTITEISRRGNVITVKKVDRSIERYDMSKKEEDKSFTQQYGVSPIPPPPPPKVEVVKFSPPVIIKKELLDDFYKRNPAVDKITSNGNITTLKMKDGRTERYNMSTKEDSERFKEKYGDSPIPPPPTIKKIS